MNTEWEKVPTEVLLRATFAAQREVHGSATNREDLDLLARLIQRVLLSSDYSARLEDLDLN